ncbi:hypothetical protein GCM10012275_17320 [Longimycelium tulufanense]|uniref:DUF559 domain-containing protein n=1 Tax=Longimycelium tulufanense TaxID=907463 RepID=A0A8J3CC22_9PSEU|nr:hypothetical protein GCM10012275_17320 [Longimycelium tulufanense]
MRIGRLRELWPGTYVPPDRVLDPITRASAALLHLGEDAVLSGPTAALAHGCTAADSQEVHVTVPHLRSRRRRNGLHVHQGDVCEDDVVELDGLRVFVLDRVIAELLCRHREEIAFMCLDQALGSLPPAYREQFRGEVNRRIQRRIDRRGVVRAEFLLDLGTGRTESPPESLLLLAAVKAGLPMPIPQYEIFDLDGHVRYRLDLAWPQLRIALEYDGVVAHEDRAQADLLRDHRLAALGWVTIRARAEDITDPQRVISELFRAFRLRGAAA